MKIIKCKICGHEIKADDNEEYVRCESCGSYNEVSIKIPLGTLRCIRCNTPLDLKKVKDGVLECSHCHQVMTFPKDNQADNVISVIKRGKECLDISNFDEAYNLFTKAIELDPSEPEGYFNRALARFKVQYLRDLVNRRMQPICHLVSDKMFSDDSDYKKSLELAKDTQKKEYQRKANEIDEIKREFAKLEAQGKDYDCFICVKVSKDELDNKDDERINKGKEQTDDYHVAHKLYDDLKDEDFNPFFSEVSIKKKDSGGAYEAHILYALYKAKCMLIVCSDEKYLDTPWMKNEYTRFKSLIDAKEKEEGSMCVAFYKKVIERIPTIKEKLQGIDLDDNSATLNVVNYIKRFLNKNAQRNHLTTVSIDTGKQEKIINTQRVINSSAIGINKKKDYNLDLDYKLIIIKNRIKNSNWTDALDNLENINSSDGIVTYYKTLAMLEIHNYSELTLGNIDLTILNNKVLKYIIDNSDSVIGQEVLNDVCSALTTIIKDETLSNESINVIKEFFDIGVYDFKPCLDLAKLLIESGINNNNLSLFKLGMPYYLNKQKTLINYLIKFLENSIKNDNISLSQIVINELDKLVEGNVKVLKCKLFLKYKVHSMDELFSLKLDNFEEIKNILQYCKDEKELCFTIDSWVNSVCEKIQSQSDDLDLNNIFNNLETLIRFMPSEMQKEVYKRIGDLAKGNKLFDLAEKYYLYTLNDNEDDHESYLNLIECEYKCKTKEDLFSITKYISNSKYYSNLINTVKNNKDLLSYYEKVEEEQAIAVKKIKEDIEIRERKTAQCKRIHEIEETQKNINKQSHNMTILKKVCYVFAFIFMIITTFVVNEFRNYDDEAKFCLVTGILLFLITVLAIANLICQKKNPLATKNKPDSTIIITFLYGYLTGWVHAMNCISPFSPFIYIEFFDIFLIFYLIYLIISLIKKHYGIMNLFSFLIGMLLCLRYVEFYVYWHDFVFIDAICGLQSFFGQFFKEEIGFILIAIVSNISLLLLPFRKKLGVKSCTLQFMSLFVPVFALIGLFSAVISGSTIENLYFNQVFIASSSFFINNPLYIALFIAICLLLPGFITLRTHSDLKWENWVYGPREEAKMALNLERNPQKVKVNTLEEYKQKVIEGYVYIEYPNKIEKEIIEFLKLNKDKNEYILCQYYTFVLDWKIRTGNNDKEKFDIMYKLANKNNIVAQCNLGYCYYYGRGVEKDYTQAVYWYKKSAEQGYDEAQYHLGYCYNYGEGVKRDYTQAVYWYKKSAVQGNVNAQYKLGECYYFGDGVEKDYTQAKCWYKKAAENGHEFAKNSLKYL